MHGVIAITDHGWYRSLLEQPDLSEVNFWRPSGRAFRALPPGGLFFFKLKARWGHAIVGFARFLRFSKLPWWLAWASFGTANGVADQAAFLERLRAIRARNRMATGKDIQIGCILLVEPVLFPEHAWVVGPRDWKPRTVSFERYDLSAGEGLRIHQACLLRAIAQQGAALEEDTRRRYGTPSLVAPRLGQGAFRVAVTEAYGRQCAVTTEHTLPVLEAAHIRPYADGGGHELSNGLLLRSDVHKLYDMGYVTVTPEFRFEVSPHLESDFGNGRAYRARHGSRIVLPEDPAERPSLDALRWHAETRFEAFAR